MSSAIGLLKLTEHLQGPENYGEWVVNATAVLNIMGKRYVLTLPSLTHADKAKEEKIKSDDEQARAVILLIIAPHMREAKGKITTAKALWDLLEAEF
jgi:hypothetical protein